MGNPVVHWEFWSGNPENLSDFYKSVFDWQIKHIPEINYRLVTPNEEHGVKGGIMQPKSGPLPAKLALYIDVPELAPYVQKIKEAGGKILVEKQVVPEVGELALFEDPDGRVIGMWKRQL